MSHTAPADKQHILDDAQTLVITSVDHAGIMRTKLAPKERIPSILRNGSTNSVSAALLLAANDVVCETAEIDSTVGDLRLIPDPTSAALLDEELGLVWITGNFVDMAGQPYPTCQRTALQRVEARAAEQQIDFKVAFELEFALFRGEELAHSGPGYGLMPFLENEAFVLDLSQALAVAGIPGEQVHPEYGHGQFEISLPPKPPTQACDDVVLAKAVIARTAIAHGMRASFAATPHVDAAANGGHIHFSATQAGEPVFYQPGARHNISPVGQQMIAGVLKYLPESIAMYAASVVSYERLQPHHWAGAYSCWGVGNREAAIRFVEGLAGKEAAQANVELKCPDNTVNPYLAVASMLGGALAGIEEQLKLPPQITVDPHKLSDAERAEQGVTRFAANLGEGIELATASTLLRALFGSKLLDSYLAVQQAEWEELAQLPLPEQIERSRWRA